MLVFIVKVCRGATVEQAEPVVVTSSPAVVKAVGEAIARELGSSDAAVIKLLRDSDAGSGS